MDNNRDSQPQSADTAEKKNPLQRTMKAFHVMEPKKRMAIVFGVGVGVLVVGVGALQLIGPKPAEPDPVPEVVSSYTPPPPPITTVPARLTGVQVEPEVDARSVTGVMIENSIDARPQAGLKDAGVVFEAIAEGGITRFLALFHESQPDHIGPIRSARPYYVQWAAGFDAGYAHSGGSPEGLALIRTLGVNDLDHGNHPGSFDRVSNRFAPHNVYTSMARLDELRASLGHTPSDFTGFERITPVVEGEAAEETTEAEGTGGVGLVVPEVEAEKANTITFDVSSFNYNSSYTYNPESNTYARVMAGQPHTDERSGEQIQPAVVIALSMSYGIHSNGIHSVYGNIGSGEVTVFQNGEVIKGTWSKPTGAAELKFTLPNGKPLLLQPGQTWITAIHNNRFSYAL